MPKAEELILMLFACVCDTPQRQGRQPATLIRSKGDSIISHNNIYIYITNDYDKKPCIIHMKKFSFKFRNLYVTTKLKINPLQYNKIQLKYHNIFIEMIKYFSLWQVQ